MDESIDTIKMEASSDKTVLSGKLSGGPHGLGDPKDRTLRKVEVEVLIPKLVREKAKAEKCLAEVSDFRNCCKESSLLMVVKCRKENSAMKECLAQWYRDDNFREVCTEQYLKQRSEFRTHGVAKKVKGLHKV